MLIMSKNHSNKVYKHRREVVIYVYNHECQCCGKTTSDLEVHHDDRNSANNEWFNLVPVCFPCHKLVHQTNFYFNYTIVDFKAALRNLDL